MYLSPPTKSTNVTSCRASWFAVAAVALSIVFLTSASQASSAYRKIFDGKPKRIGVLTNSHRGGQNTLGFYLKKYSPSTSFTVEAYSGSATYDIIFFMHENFEFPFRRNQSSPYREGIRDSTDTAQINLGVAALEEWDKGWPSATVFHTSYHYHRQPDRACKYTENDHYIFEAYSKKKGDFTGVSCLVETKREYPWHLGGDLYHPLPLGHTIYGITWLRAMILHDSLPVPEWLDAEIDSTRNYQYRHRDMTHVKYPKGGEVFHVGDTLDLAWSADCLVCIGHSAELNLAMNYTTVQKITGMPDTNPSWGHYRWVIPERLNNVRVVAPACRLIVGSRSGGGKTMDHWNWTPEFTIAAATTTLRPRSHQLFLTHASHPETQRLSLSGKLLPMSPVPHGNASGIAVLRAGELAPLSTISRHGKQSRQSTRP